MLAETEVTRASCMRRTRSSRVSRLQGAGGKRGIIVLNYILTNYKCVRPSGPFWAPMK